MEEKNFPNGEDLDDTGDPLFESEAKALKACMGDDKDVLKLAFLAFFEAEFGGGAFSSSDILAVFL